MKKKLSYIRNQNGFIFPHILLILSIVIISLFFNLYMYRNEIDLTFHYLDQINIETLFQRSYQEFKEGEYSFEELKENRLHEFHYPDGQVTIEFFTDLNHSDKGYLHFSIKTERESTFSMVKSMDFD